MNPIEKIASWLTGGNTPTSPTVAAAHIEEAGPVRVDPDDDLYRQIDGGVYNRDFTATVLRRAQDISVSLYRKNPLANRIVKIYTTYMAGTGFTISCDNPDVQEVADEFWGAERNQMQLNHRSFARDFLLLGEAPHPVATDETGNTTIGYLDPRSIDKVEANPHNQLLLEAVILTRTTGDVEPLKIVRREPSPFEPDAGLYTGDIFYWLHDRIGASTRGTPFLLPAIDWLDAYDQTLWELVERIKAVRAFFWDVEVEGGQTEVTEAKKLWGTTAPRSGSVRFRTKALTVSATQPQIGAYEDVAAARYLLRHIATAAGLSPTWLGDPEDANRSTAQEMDKPVLRALTDIQAVWKYDMESVIKFAVDRKVAAGMLGRIVERHDEQGRPTGDMVPASSLVEVRTPQLSDDEMEAAAAALVSVAGAFVQLDMIEVVDRDTLRKVVRNLLPALGIPADELPDPDDTTPAGDRQLDSGVESIYRRAERSGKLAELTEAL